MVKRMYLVFKTHLDIGFCDLGNNVVDKAICDGLISWHAMPFTTFTESMSPELMENALSLADDLDRRYGKTTCAAKMTDVPGHTKALIPHQGALK